ncbi:MAG: ATP-dependent Clp protease proteolytic subunit [Parvularculaceae bacterium]
MRSRLMLAATLLIFACAIAIAMRDDRAFLRSGPEVIVRERRGEIVFEWLFPIQPPMAAHLAAAFEKNAAKAERIVIELNSPGGMVAEGGAVIDEIERMKRSHEVETHVGANRVCASMCVPIYLAGERRTAAPSARFMFHEPTAYDVISEEEVKRPEFERRLDAERFFRRYIDPTEIDPAFAAELRASIKGRDVWFTARDLVERNTHVVDELVR